MFDKEAIEAIQQAQATRAAQDAIFNALESAHGVRQDIIGLPDDFKLHDIEDQHLTRRRARGAMNTRFIAPFVAYVQAHAEEGATVFIDPRDTSARAVLNLGTPRDPGHADNTALFTPEPTAAYAALKDIVDEQCGQVKIAEFLEDWATNIQCFAGTTEVKVPTAIASIRRITIEAMRKQESTVEQLSASKSAFESIQAKNQDTLPTFIYFNCKPYADLDERLFVLRLSILTGDDRPKLILRIQKAEEHAEQIADEMANKLLNAFGATTLPVLIGMYSRR